jgi:hypothetical protein
VLVFYNKALQDVLLDDKEEDIELIEPELIPAPRLEVE